jgi:hypothetical protein
MFVSVWVCEEVSGTFGEMFKSPLNVFSAVRCEADGGACGENTSFGNVGRLSHDRPLFNEAGGEVAA